MDIPFLYCVAGFILLGVSGEALLRGAVTTADRLKVPPLLIGLTVIAFGTSIPELTVSLNAARSGNPDIAVGNVVGSNIANILLVLGAMAVFRSFTIDAGTLNRDGRVMLGVSVLMVLMALNGVITQWMGFGLLAILAGFTFYSIAAHAKKPMSMRRRPVSMKICLRAVCFWHYDSNCRTGRGAVGF